MKRAIPQEIVDHILDDPLIRQDIQTLAACTLVCSSWLPRSSGYLFNVRPLEPQGLRELQELATTVKSSHRLPLFVTAVNILFDEHVADAIQDTMLAVVDIISALPHLEDLLVDGHPRVNDKLERCPPVFPQSHVFAQTLSLLTVSRAPGVLVDGLLNLFPAVDTLHLERMPFKVRNRQLSPHHVRRLVLTGDVDMFALSHMAAMILPSGLSELCVDAPGTGITPFNAGTPASVDHLVRMLGQQMVHFEYNHPAAAWAGSCGTSTTSALRSPVTISPRLLDSLASCTQLQTVALSAEVQSFASGTILLPWMACLQVLHNLPATITRIQFLIGIRSMDGAAVDLRLLQEGFAWPLMEEVLSHCTCLGTLEVEITVDGVDDATVQVNWRDEVRAAIAQAFSPRFRALACIVLR